MFIVSFSLSGESKWPFYRQSHNWHIVWNWFVFHLNMTFSCWQQYTSACLPALKPVRPLVPQETPNKHVWPYFHHNLHALPKRDYGNSMAKLGPYMAHMWEWHRKTKISDDMELMWGIIFASCMLREIYEKNSQCLSMHGRGMGKKYP